MLSSGLTQLIGAMGVWLEAGPESVPTADRERISQLILDTSLLGVALDDVEAPELAALDESDRDLVGEVRLWAANYEPVVEEPEPEASWYSGDDSIADPAQAEFGASTAEDVASIPDAAAGAAVVELRPTIAPSIDATFSALVAEAETEAEPRWAWIRRLRQSLNREVLFWLACLLALVVLIARDMV